MDLKFALLVVGLILVGYGYYGYFFVPANPAVGGFTPCPLEFFNDLTEVIPEYAGAECLFSFYSLIGGAILVITSIALVIFNR